MKILRKLIVRQFALSCIFKIGDKYFTMLRAPRIIFPTMLLFITFELLFKIDSTIQWWEYIFFILMLIEFWIGFDWFGIGYFSLWPIKFEELDNFQKYCYSCFYGLNNLTSEQKWEVIKIIEKHPEWQH